MLTPGNMKRLGLVLLGVVLVTGFYMVLERRFIEGGLYPHYASYRSDPLGTSVIYETLERFGTWEVSRNRKPLEARKDLDEETAILLLGYPREDFLDLRVPADSEVLRAVDAGARLVITLNPDLVPEIYQPTVSEEEEDWIEERRRIREERLRRTLAGEEGVEEEEDGEKKESEEERLEREMGELFGLRFTTRTGFSFATLEGFERPEGGWETVPGETLAAEGVPAELPYWRSQFRFELRDPAWKAVVLVGSDPVVIERRWGRGSMVVTTDSYFVSNESLHFGGEPGFLLWLLGDKKKVVFDETIHGTSESGGAMKLIRRHRAHGVFFGLFVFLILWAWRGASTLVPGNEELERGIVSAGGAVVGEETGSGFIRLLRRSVRPSELIPRCVEVWKGTLSAELPAETAGQIDRLVADHRRDPKRHGIVETYAAIAERLRKR
ncbi:MAG: hypothetical protein GXX91_03720 [Verrucomicrobiaceae bacterium]|nr:hypothetical protein [Verrucomicrobiaceae bacterium]